MGEVSAGRERRFDVLARCALDGDPTGCKSCGVALLGYGSEHFRQKEINAEFEVLEWPTMAGVLGR